MPDIITNKNKAEKFDEIAGYILEKVNDLESELDGGEDRSNDIYDSGYSDGEYDVLIEIIDKFNLSSNKKKKTYER